MSGEAPFGNRLVSEKSPYLKQHAHNPVDWYPWGQEAFEAAKMEDKPIFLSIGYSTCHWCQVMEEESFSDKEVAQALNETFICVKVDREEHPDIDSLYMEFAQSMIAGSAGWPLNVVLTPDLKPIFAATYLPKRRARGLMGVMELAERMQELWHGEGRERLFAQADRIVDIIQAHMQVQGKKEIPQEKIFQETAELLFRVADPVWGGMRGAPKFPLGYQSNFLISHFLRSRENRALFLVEKTLDMMHRGGLYDHLLGGFHRYSVDEKWRVPHFEKMVYDNAILAYAYLEAWKVTKNEQYKIICEEVLRYLAENMQHSAGGFYAAQGADSDGVEGRFYTWEREEVVALLGEEEGALFCDFYGLHPQAFEEAATLYIQRPLEEFAKAHGEAQELIGQRLAVSREKLLRARAKRVWPMRDEKILTAWNGLAIHAFAEAGRQLDRPDYIACAVKAASFLKEWVWKNHVLFRRYCDGEVRFLAGCEDHAFLIRGLLSLFETGPGMTEWLSWAIELSAILERNFRSEGGVFYQADAHEALLIIRKPSLTDSAEPSGNAIHAENLIRLFQITQDERFLHQAEGIFKAVAGAIEAYPLGYCYHLISLQRYYDHCFTMLIALNDAQEGIEAIQHALQNKVLPHTSLIWKDAQDEHLARLLPYAASYVPQGGKTTLYVCRDGACLAPVVGIEAIEKAIQEL